MYKYQTHNYNGLTCSQCKQKIEDLNDLTLTELIDAAESGQITTEYIGQIYQTGYKDNSNNLNMLLIDVNKDTLKSGGKAKTTWLLVSGTKSTARNFSNSSTDFWASEEADNYETYRSTKKGGWPNSNLKNASDGSGIDWFIEELPSLITDNVKTVSKDIILQTDMEVQLLYHMRLSSHYLPVKSDILLIEVNLTIMLHMQFQMVNT